MRIKMLKYILCLFIISFVAGNCPPPDRPNAEVICKISKNKKRCHFKCPAGFKKFGPTNIVCNKTAGAWSEVLGYCSKCSPITTPLYSTSTWSQNRNGDISVQITCDEWTNLIGPERLTCPSRSRKWDFSAPPTCLPDFSLCKKNGIPRCPRVSSSMHREMAQYSDTLNDELRETIAALSLELGSTSVNSRNQPSRLSSCYKSFCKVPCLLLPRKRWTTLCVRCKKLKRINCSRYGKVFSF